MFGDSNSDCRLCAFSRYFDDGGGDYEDMVYHCEKLNKRVTHIRADNKPCGLDKGKYYVATYSVNT